MNFTGGGDFVAIGNELLGHLVTLAELRPHDRVLDVGCGLGRVARALTSYLSPVGRYEGFDIDRGAIRWCRSQISARHPSCRFQEADVYNQMYRPRGRWPASRYTFPYPDRTFDIVFATSVFTHMVSLDVGNYLREIARVLEPGGRCLLTFFVLDEVARAHIAEGKSSFAFVHALDGCFTSNPDLPEAAIAYGEEDLRALFARHGFSLPRIHYGAWSGRVPHLSGQDILVATRLG
jgi:SAM-dependent methyltransferase